MFDIPGLFAIVQCRSHLKWLCGMGLIHMTQFETECRAGVNQLRTAFIELYDSIGADPSSPQDVARKLRVGSTLAWNVTRLIQSADELAAVNHVPGSSSLEKIIQA